MSWIHHLVEHAVSCPTSKHEEVILFLAFFFLRFSSDEPFPLVSEVNKGEKFIFHLQNVPLIRIIVKNYTNGGIKGFFRYSISKAMKIIH